MHIVSKFQIFIHILTMVKLKKKRIKNLKGGGEQRENRTCFSTFSKSGISYTGRWPANFWSYLGFSAGNREIDIRNRVKFPWHRHFSLLKRINLIVSTLIYLKKSKNQPGSIDEQKLCWITGKTAHKLLLLFINMTKTTFWLIKDNYCGTRGKQLWLEYSEYF